MVANNPKKKRQYVTKDKSSEKDKNAMVKAADNAVDKTGPASEDLLEQHLGETLLTAIGKPPKPTKELLKGKTVIGFYFSASWSFSCETFTPQLVDFYNKVAKNNNMEIVFVSSDNDLDSFEEYYGKMPWLAIEGDEKGTGKKHSLATHLKAFRLPALYILNVESGEFVTDAARREVVALSKPMTGEDGKEVPVDDKVYEERGKELIKSWLERSPSPIGEGTFSSDTLGTIEYYLDYAKNHPIITVVLVLFFYFANVIQQVKNNPLLGVAFWILFKNFGGEKLARNEPYIVQERKPIEEDKKEDGDEKEEKDEQAKKDE